MSKAPLIGYSVLELDDVYGLWTLIATLNPELDAVALIKVAEAFALDGAVVQKDVSAAIIGSCEAVTLRAIEPLYCADLAF